MSPESVEHRSGPARFVALPGMTWVRRMTLMNYERLYFAGRHCDLATSARKGVSKNEKGSFVFLRTHKCPCEAMLHPDTLLYKGPFFDRQ